MPLYEYECPVHGAFSALRRLDARNEPCPCAVCGAASPRGAVGAAMLAALPEAARRAHAANERSAHAPQNLAQYRTRHRPGCGCCGGGTARRAPGAAGAMKGFAGRRPWQISH